MENGNTMLTPVDREVLSILLIDGDNAPKNIADIIDRHPNSVLDSLDRLHDADFVRNKGGGVYGLTYRGCTTARSVLREFEVDIPSDFQ